MPGSQAPRHAFGAGGPWHSVCLFLVVVVRLFAELWLKVCKFSFEIDKLQCFRRENICQSKSTTGIGDIDMGGR